MKLELSLEGGVRYGISNVRKTSSVRTVSVAQSHKEMRTLTSVAGCARVEREIWLEGCTLGGTWMPANEGGH